MRATLICRLQAWLLSVLSLHCKGSSMINLFHLLYLQLRWQPMVVASYLSKSQTFISVVAAAPDDEVLLVDETEGVL